MPRRNDRRNRPRTEVFSREQIERRAEEYAEESPREKEKDGAFRPGEEPHEEGDGFWNGKPEDHWPDGRGHNGAGDPRNDTQNFNPSNPYDVGPDIHKLQGSNYPLDCIKAGGGPTRVEPIINGEEMKQRFLFGIPLYAPFDPSQKITKKDLDTYVTRGIAQVEMDTRTTVSPVTRSVRLPFDPNLYYNNIWLEVPHKPVQLVLGLEIQSASYIDTGRENENARYPHGAEIYHMPSQWIDVSYAAHGRLFINPINPAFAAVGFTESAASSGATILQFIGIQGWVPAYWTIRVVTGFCSQEGNVPVIVNEAIGQKAAMLLIDNLIQLFRYTNQSLNLDGMGQSTTDEMNRLLRDKRSQLEKDYKASVLAIKQFTGGSFFVSNV